MHYTVPALQRTQGGILVYDSCVGNRDSGKRPSTTTMAPAGGASSEPNIMESTAKMQAFPQLPVCNTSPWCGIRFFNNCDAITSQRLPRFRRALRCYLGDAYNNYLTWSNTHGQPDRNRSKAFGANPRWYYSLNADVENNNMQGKLSHHDVRRNRIPTAPAFIATMRFYQPFTPATTL